jgi:hypothetical protein
MEGELASFRLHYTCATCFDCYNEVLCVHLAGQGLLANVDNVSPMRALTPLVLETFHKFNSTADANVQQALLQDLLEVPHPLSSTQ